MASAALWQSPRLGGFTYVGTRRGPAAVWIGSATAPRPPLYGPPRVSGQAALRQARHRRAERRGREHRRGRRSRRPSEIGYPCAIKAQVLIGGRGKAGGIKIAADAEQAREYADAILGMDIVGPHGEGPFRVDQVWIEGGSDIASEYYASVILDRGEKKLLAMVSAKGGMDIEAVAAEDPEALVKVHIDPTREFDVAAAREIVDAAGLDEDVRDQAAEVLVKLAEVATQRGREPDRGQPADRHLRPRGRRARRQGHDRRQRPLPPPGPGRDRRHGRGSAGGRWRRRRASPTSSSTATSASSPTAPGSACRRSTSSPRRAALRPTSSTPAAAPKPRRSSTRSK